jgi:hypothetical protein
VIRKRRDGLQVQVYAGRDPLTGRKRWVSRQVPGKGRAAMKRARQVEAELLGQVAAGQHQRITFAPRSMVTWKFALQHSA